MRSLAQVDGVVVAVGEAESEQQSPGRLEPERVDQLLAQQSHRRRAQDHDALLVQPDNALVRTKIQQFCEVQVRRIGDAVATRLRLHDTAIV